MKKIASALLFSMFLMTAPAFCETYNASAKVQSIGEKLLEKSEINTSNAKFMVVSGTANNANYSANKVINISSEKLAFAGNDNEVASVVGAELGHIILGHSSRQKLANMLGDPTASQKNDSVITQQVKKTASDKQTLNNDKDADLVAVNLMVSAGYNPLASIVVLTKMQGTYMDVLVGRPSNYEQALNIYNYISYAYPNSLKAGYGCKEYKAFVAYADDDIKNKLASNKKYENQTKKQYTKAQKNTAKNIQKFKTRGGLSVWDAVAGILSE